HSPIRQVACVTADTEFVRRALREVPKSHALHNSRHKISPGLFRVAHKTVDCSRRINPGESCAIPILCPTTTQDSADPPLVRSCTCRGTGLACPSSVKAPLIYPHRFG